MEELMTPKEFEQLLHETKWNQIPALLKEAGININTSRKKEVVFEEAVAIYTKIVNGETEDEVSEEEVSADNEAVQAGIDRITLLLKGDNPEAKRKALLKKRNELEGLLK